MASVVEECIAGGRDLLERIFPPGNGASEKKGETVRDRQSEDQREGGRSDGCGCASSARSCGQEPWVPAPIKAETTEEAVELSLKAFVKQLGAEFSDSEFLTERILELVAPSVAPDVINEVVGAYLKRRDWQSAMAVARKAGRELTDDEIQKGFSVLANGAKLEGFMGLAEATGKKPEPDAYIRLISQVSRRSGSDIDWSKLVQVLDAGAPQKAIDQAVILCARSNSTEEEADRLAGFEIISSHAVSDDARQVFLDAFIDTGSVQQAQMAAQKIFGRPLSTDEFCRVTTAASQIAEAKRAQTQQSYESSDD